MRHLAFAIALFALPAIAQDGGESGFCVAQADRALYQVDCIGLTAERCMQSTLDQSTLGMSECLNAELEWWDARLNRAYQLLRDREAQEDADMAADGVNAPIQAEALRDMQRAWITYRDAACDFARSQWGGGTGGGPATLSCLLRQTALQAIHLQSYLEDY